MDRIIREHIDEIARICRQRNVHRLAVFGSAAGERFDREKSDLDFLVEFNEMQPMDHAEQYFSLAEDLERLFSRPVDLVEPQTIRNPYFQRSIENTYVTLYAAA